MNEFFTILTNVGLARLANATATGTTVTLATIRLGDGGGAAYNPTPDQTNVRREVWRGNITLSRVVPNNPNWIEVEIDVPADVGGFMIREAGLFDSTGAMIAIARYPETFKPQVDSGSAKELKVRMIIQVSNASALTIQFDPSVVTVSQAQLNETLENAGFGANNLIFNAQEPRVVNPAGNDTQVVLQGFLTLVQPNTRYSITIDANMLQGSSNNLSILSFHRDIGSAEIGVGAGHQNNLPIIDGKVTRTWTTTANLPEGRELYIAIVPGSGSEGAFGLTLQFQNVMLVKGELPQEFRRRNQDDFEQIEEMRTLKPQVRRSFATFEGKVAGSTDENPHIANWADGTTGLASPTAWMTEGSQGTYNILSVINFNRWVVPNFNVNTACQKRFTFNIIEHLTRTYSESIWQGFTELEDKVRIAREIVSRVAFVWDGFGVTNGVNWSGIRIASSLSDWSTVWINNTNSIVTRQTLAITSQAHRDVHILDDGTCRFLVHTAEGQETPIGGATLTTAFVQFEVDVETTLQPIGYSPSWAEFQALSQSISNDLEDAIKEPETYSIEDLTEIEELKLELQQMKNGFKSLVKSFAEISKPIKDNGVIEGEYEIVNPLPEIEIPDEYEEETE